MNKQINSLSELFTTSYEDQDKHLRILRELADVVVKPLSIIYEKSCQSGELPGNKKKGNSIPVLQKGRKEDAGNRLLQLISVPGGNVKAHAQ